MAKKIEQYAISAEGVFLDEQICSLEDVKERVIELIEDGEPAGCVEVFKLVPVTVETKISVKLV